MKPIPNCYKKHKGNYFNVFPENRDFFLLDSYEKIKDFKTTNFDDPEYIYVISETKENNIKENLYVRKDFLSEYDIIKVTEIASKTDLNFIISKRKIGSESRLLTEIILRPLLMKEICRKTKINLNKNVELRFKELFSIPNELKLYNRVFILYIDNSKSNISNNQNQLNNNFMNNIYNIYNNDFNNNENNILYKKIDDFKINNQNQKNNGFNTLVNKIDNNIDTQDIYFQKDNNFLNNNSNIYNKNSQQYFINNNNVNNLAQNINQFYNINDINNPLPRKDFNNYINIINVNNSYKQSYQNQYNIQQGNLNNLNIAQNYNNKYTQPNQNLYKGIEIRDGTGSNIKSQTNIKNNPTGVYLPQMGINPQKGIYQPQKGEYPLKGIISNLPEANNSQLNTQVVYPANPGKITKEIIGRGGFGTVYKFQYNGKIYALKQIPLEKLNEKEKSDYEKEAQFLSKFNNEYIVKYYDSFSKDNKFNIIMEYAGNKTLKSYIKDRGDKLIDSKTLNNIIKQICLGLKEIHKENIIHRDISPDNIFIDEKNLKIKIGDFGISTISQYSYSPVGKYKYMAPEMQLEVEDEKKKVRYNKSVDIYALGCVLYELFTLRNYFDDDRWKKIEKITLEFYDEKWQKLIDSMLAIKYHERPSIEEVLSKLD